MIRDSDAQPMGTYVDADEFVDRTAKFKAKGIETYDLILLYFLRKF